MRCIERLVGMSVIALSLLSAVAHARFEVIGPVYPIAERDAIAMIEARLHDKERNGELAKLEADAIARARRSIEAPRTGAELPEARSLAIGRLDPSIVARDSVRDDRGAVLVRAGQRVNPLEHVRLSKMLVFFDGRSQAQVMAVRELVKREGMRVKPILAAGEPLRLTRTFAQAVYFDQGGKLVERFGIRALPALVRQDGATLVVETMPPALLTERLASAAPTAAVRPSIQAVSQPSPSRGDSR